MLKIEQIAEVAHELNRAYCLFNKDKSQEPWNDAPDYVRDSIMEGIQNIIDNPDITPAQSHASWLARKLKEGWSFGKKKDGRKKEHPALLPYSKLAKEQRLKDTLFTTVVKQLLKLQQLDQVVEFDGSFESALSAMKDGERVTRIGLAPMYVNAEVYLVKNDFIIASSNRGLEPTWKPSEQDLLATDWRIIKK